MNREALDRGCERGILALVLAILVFGPLALGAVRGLEFAILEGLALGVMLLWGLRLWISPRPQLLWPPICWPVLVFALYAIARYCTADVEYLARQELLRVLVYAFLFIAILNNLYRQETTQVIGLTLIFLAMAISFYAIYQWMKDSDYVWRFIKPYPHRGSGTYICPNHLAGFLEMLLPLSLSYTLAGRLKPATKVCTGYAALVIAGGIAVSGSRGGWLATAPALLVLFGVFLCYRSYRLPAALTLVLILAGGLLFSSKSFLVHLRLKQLPDQQAKIAEDMRFALWQPAVRMWQEHLWWGVGPAHYDARFPGYRPEGVQLRPIRAHNDYLNTLADWGLAGAALVASAWGLLGIGVYKTWLRTRIRSGDLGGERGSNRFAFLLGASVGLLAILFHSVADFNMHIPANAILVVALMALLSSCLRFATERYWFRLRAWSKCLASAILLAGMIYLAPQARRMALEFVWLDRAAHEANFSSKQIDFLTRAFRIEPKNPQTAYAIAEALRWQSQEGSQYYEGLEGVDYRRLAEQALGWFQRARDLNPWDSRPCSGAGWCLDWLDRPAESSTYFSQAEQLDPNNYYTLNSVGRHYIQVGNYAAARPWFERSLRLEPGNDVAFNYLQIANSRLLEAATNPITSRLDALPH
jgi:O-antigen ligase